MIKNNINKITVLLVVLAIAFTLSPAIAADSPDPEDTELAIVNSYEVQSETGEDLTADDIYQAADELGFELTVDYHVLEEYVSGDLEAVNNLKFENITDDVDDISEADKIEDFEDKDEVANITDEVVDEISD
ncbi:MAG: hypothetical protein ACQEQD_10080 [Bacillota bacterium]